VFDGLCQRFSTSSTHTPRGMSAVAKGYSGKNIVTKYFFQKQITQILSCYAAIELFYVLHKIMSNTFVLLGILCYSRYSKRFKIEQHNF